MNTPSAAAQVIVTIIPIVGIVFGFVAILMYLILNHKQKILLIEKGIPRSKFDFETFSLFSGLILTFVGASLLCFFILKSGISYGMLSGLITFSVGISLIVFFSILRKSSGKKNIGNE